MLRIGADPDPTFFFNADPDLDPALLQSDAILRLLVYRPLSLYAAIVSVYGPPWLHCEPLQLLHIDLDADPPLNLIRILVRRLKVMRILIRNTQTRRFYWP